MLLRLLPLTALLLLLGGTWAASQEVPDCWCMIRNDAHHDSLAIDTCGINPMNYSCDYFRFMLFDPSSIVHQRFYAKGPWLLVLKDSTIVLPPMPTRYEDTTFFSYKDVADSTLRSIILDIEQRYGYLSLYRLLRNRHEDHRLFLYFDYYVNSSDISRYFDSLNYFFHYLEAGVIETVGNVIQHHQKQHYQLLNNVVSDFLRIKIHDSDEYYHNVQIHSIDGTSIINNKLTANSLSLAIDVSELPVGMYIISMESLYQPFYVVR